MLTIDKEDMIACLHELVPLWNLNYEESGRRTQPFVPHWQVIFGFAAKPDRYLLMTIRDEGKLVGYAHFILTRLAQHANSVHAILETIYLLPQYRKGAGATVLKLVSACEIILQQMGANAVRYSAVPWVKHEKGGVGKLWKFMGAKPLEVIYEKALTPNTAGKFKHGRRSTRVQRTAKPVHSTVSGKRVS